MAGYRWLHRAKYLQLLNAKCTEAVKQDAVQKTFRDSISGLGLH